MKALMSKRASELFADPAARKQLRVFLMNKQGAAQPTALMPSVVVTHSDGKQYKLEVVPKAEAAS